MVIVCLVVAVGFLDAPRVSAYDETTLKYGGVVAGKITYQGTPPPPEHFQVIKNSDVCGAERDRYSVRVKNSDTVRLECDQHNFMLSWTKVVSNPYWVMTGNDGSYAIDQVPPGTYILVVWHPTLGEQRKEITVPKNGSVEAGFTF